MPKKKYCIVDNETGEVIGETNERQSNNLSGRYLKVFFDDPGFRKRMSSTAYSLMFYVAARMPYSGTGGSLALPINTRKKISALSGISLASIEKGLTELVKTECLYRVQRGEYLVNPYMFGRGSGAAIRARREEWDSLVGHPHGSPATGQETASENETAPA